MPRRNEGKCKETPTNYSAKKPVKTFPLFFIH